MPSVYSDINTRYINPQADEFLSKDASAVVQSIWRLITTVEGEIPYYRSYGCNLKIFEQYPLTDYTADEIFEYVKEKVDTFEPRGTIVSADAVADASNNKLTMKFYIQVKTTGETGVLPDLDVVVKGNS
jgi:phage baseplate assembly protein W